MNACTSPSFCRFPFESSRIGRSRTTSNRSTSVCRSVGVHRPAQPSERVELLAAGQPIEQAKVARHIPDLTLHLDAGDSAVVPEE